MTPEVKKRIEQIHQGIVPDGYTKTRSGITPTTWTPACLGNIYTERREPGNESLPLLTVSIHSGVSDGELDEDELPKKVKRIEDKSQYKRAATGDLVFNMMRAWQGAIGTVRTEGMVSPAYIVAKPNGKVYPPFMDYYMKAPRMVGMINRQSYGVTDFRKRLYWDSFAPIPCVLPPVREQRKIAEILATQDKVIELKEKLLAEKRQQKKYLMQQLLTGKKRLSGYGDKWLKTRLGDISFMNSGGTPNSQDPSNFGDEYVWVSISDMRTTEKYLLSSEKMLSQKGYATCSAKIYPKGTVLFAMYASIGECVITNVECCSSQAIIGIEPFDCITNEYLYYHLLNGREEFKKLSQASSQPNLNKGIVESFMICFPQKDEQNLIVNILSTADKEITLLHQDIIQEKNKKKALMQLLLMGIVRV